MKQLQPTKSEESWDKIFGKMHGDAIGLTKIGVVSRLLFSGPENKGKQLIMMSRATTPRLRVRQVMNPLKTN